MNKKRRELLSLLSLASATLVLPFPDVDWERIEDVFTKQSQVDEETLRDLETMNAHYWSVYRLSSSKGLVLDGVLKQLRMLVGMLKVSHVTNLHTWLCRVKSDLSQLAGEIFFDANDYDTAQSCYVFSATAAKEATAYDLWACALIRHSFLPIFDEQHVEALPLLHRAKRLAQRGDQSLATRFWVEAVSADAQSGIGNVTLCRKSLDLAQEVTTLPNTSSNGGWLRFDGTRLSEQRGVCYTNLGESRLAELALQEALSQQNNAGRRKAIILTNLVKVALQQDEVEHACTLMDEVIDIAMKKPSGVISKGIFNVGTQLAPYQSLQVVKDLNQHMKLLG
jgi:tetratricopeptide (TPR) repeat protein